MAALVCSTVCNGLGGGLGSGVFAWFTGATGIARSMANTTAPLFQNAFYYGAINGATVAVIGTLSLQAQQTTRIENPGVLLAWNVTVLALTTISRYGVAKACNEMFNAKITTSYVHIGTALHIIFSPCSLLFQTGFISFANQYRNDPQALRERWGLV